MDCSYFCLSYLPVEDLIKARCVSKEVRAWVDEHGLRIIEEDLKVRGCVLSIFNKAVWESCLPGGLEGAGFRIDSAVEKIGLSHLAKVSRMCSALSKYTGNTTSVTLLTIPEGVSVKKLQQKLMLDCYMCDFEDMETTKTSLVAITPHLLQYSRGKEREDHESLLRKFRCQIPRAIHVVSLFGLMKRYLGNFHPFITPECYCFFANYTRCKEVSLSSSGGPPGIYNVAVGLVTAGSGIFLSSLSSRGGQALGEMGVMALYDFNDDE